MGVLVPLLVFVAVSGVGAAVWLVRRRRDATGVDRAPTTEWEHRMRALETALGWRFVAGDPGLGERVPRLGRMLEGDRDRVRCQLVGHWRGVPVLAVEVLLRNPATGEYAEYAVVVLPRPVPGPWLLISPRDDHAWGLFEQSTATGDPAFDARYEVRRRNPAFATALLGSGLPAALLHDPRAVGVALVFDEENLAVVVPGSVLQAPLTTAADLLADIAARVPWQALPRG
ncbi:hypothetical protein [Saccharothrix obliqua]|uniref:hypothetical protein n=1 Tax=Saccharothrix obliqua TaxID=2861747 RepID=UPI001C5D328A|nr:hypothetical protein [Saccharothrix obliqua]MBW4715619.1 hypothetical protein [Saccharothrix obliqua]